MSTRIDQEPILIGTSGVGAGNTRINQADLMLAVNARFLGYGNTRINQAALLMFTGTSPFTLFPIPANPNEQPQTMATTDVNSVNSRTGGGLETWYTAIPAATVINKGASNTNQPYVIKTGNPVVTRADGALWDIVAGQYVSLDQTSIGTGRTSKNGQ